MGGKELSEYIQFLPAIFMLLSIKAVLITLEEITSFSSIGNAQSLPSTITGKVSLRMKLHPEAFNILIASYISEKSKPDTSTLAPWALLLKKSEENA
ncbi:hypothetical protein ANAPRD1_00505 [Anaplasma phagocytophilum]|nr:hypothetical protein ANAPH1_00190 [Anaplasma phagocytophilum]SCV63873.1 hypothetical protein ANAPRD1_00505 [Anaplasma phagocytophilum]